MSALLPMQTRGAGIGGPIAKPALHVIPVGAKQPKAS
jgi:hypothetical protein